MAVGRCGGTGVNSDNVLHLMVVLGDVSRTRKRKMRKTRTN